MSHRARGGAGSACAARNVPQHAALPTHIMRLQSLIRFGMELGSPAEGAFLLVAPGGAAHLLPSSNPFWTIIACFTESSTMPFMLAAATGGGWGECDTQHVCPCAPTQPSQIPCIFCSVQWSVQLPCLPHTPQHTTQHTQTSVAANAVPTQCCPCQGLLPFPPHTLLCV